MKLIPLALIACFFAGCSPREIVPPSGVNASYLTSIIQAMELAKDDNPHGSDTVLLNSLKKKYLPVFFAGKTDYNNTILLLLEVSAFKESGSQYVAIAIYRDSKKRVSLTSIDRSGKVVSNEKLAILEQGNFIILYSDLQNRAE